MLFKGKDPKPKIFLDVLFLSCLGFTPPCLGFTPSCFGFTLSLLGVYPLGWAEPGVDHRGLPPKWAPAHVSGQRGKPSNTFNNEFDIFFGGRGNGISGLYLGFTPLAWPWRITGVIYLGFTPLGLGFTPLALLWVYPFDWAKPGVYPPDHTGFTPQMGSPPRFEAKG